MTVTHARQTPLVGLILLVFAGTWFTTGSVMAQPPTVKTPAATESDVNPVPEKEPAPAATENGETGTLAQSMPILYTLVKLVAKVPWYFLAPFLLATFIAICFGIERLVVLRRGRVIPRAFVDRFLQHLEQNQLDQNAALELCEGNNSPVASVFAHGVRKWNKPSVEVEQAIIDGGERQVSQLRKHLRVLNGVSTIAPLLGLLGTVVGMILAFTELASLYPLPKYLGVSIASKSNFVESVESDSIADEAGLTPGMNLLKVNGTSVKDLADIHKTLDALPESKRSLKILAKPTDGEQAEYTLSLKQDWKKEATDKAFRLANGIGVALLTTVFGLLIAIPSLILYMYLAGRVDSLVMEMDLLAQDVVHLISMEGLAKDAASRPKSRRSTATKKKAV